MRIVSIILILLGLSSCNDNKIASKYDFQRIIVNKSNHSVTTKLYLSDVLLAEADISQNGVWKLSGRCVVTGQSKTCSSTSFVLDVFHEVSEDSVHLIFDNERILRLIGNEWSNIMEGEGTRLITYSYEITNEDYDAAIPIE